VRTLLRGFLPTVYIYRGFRLVPYSFVPLSACTLGYLRRPRTLILISVTYRYLPY
jgi:hypothetical protein